jgi:hypothetical protein
MKSKLKVKISNLKKKNDIKREESESLDSSGREIRS